MAVAEVRQLPTGRLLAVDDRGVGLRATWHLERGIVNLSLWRDDTCVETFHLSIEDAGRLTGFLVDGFAQVTQAAVAPAPRPTTPLARRRASAGRSGGASPTTHRLRRSLGRARLGPTDGAA